MKLKTYQAWTMAEALAFVKTDLGADAVILHTRTFDRGGFFGIGRRAVVEITAARAIDMPRTERVKSATRIETKDMKPSSSSRAGVGNYSREDRSHDNRNKQGNKQGIERVQLSAAARAYGTPTSAGTVTATNAAPAEFGLDMTAEREKTRRLAQAMAIQLEKQASVREASEVNARATRAAASTASSSTSSTTSSSASPAFPSTHLVATTAPAGPAQRFVLVPEPTNSSAKGTDRLTAALVREAPAVAQRHALLGNDRMEAIAVEKTAAVKQMSPPAKTPTPARATNELDTISAFVGRVLEQQVDRRASATTNTNASTNTISPAVRTAPAVARAPGSPLDIAYARLIEQEVAKDLAERITSEVERELRAAVDAGDEPSAETVRLAFERRIKALLPSDDLDSMRMLPGKHGARRIAFVGPTGVGKTTTLAKIAAQLSLKHGLRVGIVAADTYRIAAVDQLRTYAEILGIRVEVASSPTEAARACERLGDVDAILIDTAGRSQNDRMKLSELRAFLAGAQPDETHLVLSATASARTLAREAEAFGVVGVDRLVLTKLDEAASFGTLISLVERLGTRVSFLTHGQEVPDHIEIARGGRLAALVMGTTAESEMR